jgi:uncharacterized membrane protein YfcA
MVGGFLGASRVPKVNEKIIKTIIALALSIIVIFMCLKQFNFISKLQSDNTATALYGKKLIFICIFYLLIGFFGSFGVGAYSISIVICTFLGLSPIVSWPIMSANTCIRTCVSAISFIKTGFYELKQSLCTNIGGAIGVIVAALLFNYIKVILLVYLAMIVIFITSIQMLYSVIKQKKQA